MSIASAHATSSFLNLLVNLRADKFRSGLQRASSNELRSLFWVIKTFLSGNFPLIPSQVRTMKPYASVLRKASKCKSLEAFRTFVLNNFDRQTVMSLLNPLIFLFTSGEHEAQVQSTAVSNDDVKHHSSDKSSAVWICEYCQKTGYTRRSYREHLNTHRNYCDLPFVCSTCTKRYASSSALSRHKAKCQLIYA